MNLTEFKAQFVREYMPYCPPIHIPVTYYPNVTVPWKYPQSSNLFVMGDGLADTTQTTPTINFTVFGRAEAAE